MNEIVESENSTGSIPRCSAISSPPKTEEKTAPGSARTIVLSYTGMLTPNQRYTTASLKPRMNMKSSRSFRRSRPSGCAYPALRPTVGMISSGYQVCISVHYKTALRGTHRTGMPWLAHPTLQVLCRHTFKKTCLPNS